VSGSIGQSHLSLKNIYLPVSATQLGLPYNPTADVVQFAFLPQPTQVPQPTDLVPGAWETWTTDVLYPYRAKCLVGPGGAITLGIGNYVIWVKISDNPEIPFDIVGQLQIS